MRAADAVGSCCSCGGEAVLACHRCERLVCGDCQSGPGEGVWRCLDCDDAECGYDPETGLDGVSA